MKYLKKYNKFNIILEYQTYDDSELIYDSDIIEKYFNFHYKPSEEDYSIMQSLLFSFVDETEILNQEKQNNINNFDFVDDDTRYIDFIKYYYNESDYGYLDLDFDYNHPKYHEKMELLLKFLEEYEDDPERYIGYCWDKQENNNLQVYLDGMGYGPETYYDYLQMYVNKKDLNAYIIDNADEYKMNNFYVDNITKDKAENVFEYDEDNIIILYDLISVNDIYDIYDTFEIQDKYVQLTLNKGDETLFEILDRLYNGGEMIFDDEFLKKYDKEYYPEKKSNEFNL